MSRVSESTRPRSSEREVSNQVEMEVHVGPGNARHAVEPEARYGCQVPLERHQEIVLVRHVLVVGCEEELGEGLDLK